MLHPNGSVILTPPSQELRARSPSPFTPRDRRKSLPQSASTQSLEPLATSINAAPSTPSATSATSHHVTHSPSRNDSPVLEFANGRHHPKGPRTPFASDLEAQSSPRRHQHPRKPSTKVPTHPAVEYTVPTRTKFLHLATWFALNLVLTIYNKALLQGFSFPWLLTAIHASCVSAGCYALLLSKHFTLTRLKRPDHVTLTAFSLLFTVNIAISNVSLAKVSVPFHQIMRSTCPVFTILIQRLVFGRGYGGRTYAAIVPIVAGVALATYGDYYFSVAGFLLTLFGVVLASLKTVVSNRLMTGSLSLPALEILLRMSPLAAMQALCYAWITGEFQRFLAFAASDGLPPRLLPAVAGNGVLAFLLNVSSFQTNRISGALTLTVAGNLKQCLTILLGIVLFQVRVGWLNGVGMGICVLGGWWYSKVELDRKGRK
ncbi:MAG: hypothetical protein Q9159_003618 [Coniocarpon cinnabarinum]